jgi:hypothetical protein
MPLQLLKDKGTSLNGSEEMVLLVDKLGERLAFERSGTRLYETLLSKFDSYGPFEGGPERAELEENSR